MCSEVIHTCRRCGTPLEPNGPYPGFCCSSHRTAARKQKQALIAAGPGCRHCFRGAVFFDWRPSGGRRRSEVTRLEAERWAACWCPAGQRMGRLLMSAYKAWGYMLDHDGRDERVIAPQSPPMLRWR